MAEYDGLTPGQILADASVAEFIKTLGLGIAEAQKALDENSVDQIAEFIEPREGLGGKTLLDLGLSPAFYHYQHADISCSLQLSLKVEKNLSLGLNLNGSFNDTSTNSGSSNESETSTESGSSTRTESRQANIEITSASAGALSVGGQQFQLNGGTPSDRIENLRDALTSNSGSGITRVLSQFQPSPLNITTDAAAEKVFVTQNTVALISGGLDSGIIRIATNTDTIFSLDDAPTVITATTTAQDSLANYAAHVETQIEAQGYNARVVAPGDNFYPTPLFETGKATLRAQDQASVTNYLKNMAAAMKQMNFPVSIEGFADRQLYTSVSITSSDNLNVRLGNDRANTLKQILIDNGAPPALISTSSRGDGAATDASNARGQDNQDFRKAEIKTTDRTHYWIFVHAIDGGPNLNAVLPDKIGNTSAENGFIYLFKPTPLGLSGKKVTVESIDFPFRGAAIGGHILESPEAYAKNLADDINGNSSANLKASVLRNVVTISRDGDKFQLTLVSSEQRQITLSGTSGITVTEEFSRTRSSNLTRQNTGNRTVAVGASLDVGYSRKFGMNVTGNSSISARLVSIPAPAQFLETIQNYLNQDE